MKTNNHAKKIKAQATALPTGNSGNIASPVASTSSGSNHLLPKIELIQPQEPMPVDIAVDPLQMNSMPSNYDISNNENESLIDNEEIVEEANGSSNAIATEPILKPLAEAQAIALPIEKIGNANVSFIHQKFSLFNIDNDLKICSCRSAAANLWSYREYRIVLTAVKYELFF